MTGCPHGQCPYGEPCWQDCRDAALSRATQAERERDEFKARLEALEGPHVLILSEDRWTIEHSLACRESGDMAECEIHQRVADWIDGAGEPQLSKGRYIVGEGPFPNALDRER